MTDLPHVIAGAGPLRAFLLAERSRVEDCLARIGAVLFRGFDVGGASGFEAAAEVFAERLHDYEQGISPRRQVAGKVYTSTEVDARYVIPMHCEMAYSPDPPRRLLFHCHQPAAKGGETPIADVRRVYARVQPALREKLEREGVLLFQMMGELDGFRAGWPAAFGTTSRAEVERLCAGRGIGVRWLQDGALRLEIRGPAVVRHPRTGEPVWFNNLLVNHDHYSRVLWQGGLRLTAAALRVIEWLRPASRRPFDCYFGGGERIGVAALAQLRAAFEAETVRFPWRAGDVLLLDNFAVAHGREAYAGPRAVQVVLLDRAPLGQLAAGPARPPPPSGLGAGSPAR